MPPAPIEDLSLNAGDVFAIRVFGETDMSQDYRVAPDGTIDFPYLGRVHVAGSEPSRIADEIQGALRDRQILRNPQVSVYVRELSSRSITIVGAVARPGTFPFTPNMSIVQAVSVAGGFSGIADQSAVRLTRSVRGGSRRTYVIPVDMMIDGRIANITLGPGDVLSVPERVF